MSVIIQIIIVVYFCSVICFLSRPNCGATLSHRAYWQRAQDSEVTVVSLFVVGFFLSSIFTEYNISIQTQVSSREGLHVEGNRRTLRPSLHDL